MWSNQRIVNAFKRKIRQVLASRGEVSAADLHKNMRSQITGPGRGSLISRAFRELQDEGSLFESGTKVNPRTKSRVKVYTEF